MIIASVGSFRSLIVRASAALALAGGLALATSVASGQADAAGGGGQPPVVVEIDPNWINTLPPGEWCGTHQRYIAELVARGINPPDGVCPQDGPCDDPVNRNAAIPTGGTPIKTYRLSIHVFCQNDGSNCAATLADVDAAVVALNALYLPWRIQFNYDTNFINSTKYRTLSPSEERGMKRAYADSPATKLNVYVVNTGGVCWGTFPWGQNALTKQGGIVMHERWFAVDTAVFTHEVGHCLGLWHTFHGVSEVTPCGQCYELAGRTPDQGDVTGDRCSDTVPTPRNSTCSDPGGNDFCNNVPWGPTDLLNYMAYSCLYSQNEFTEHQAGRMHCWTTAILTGWLR